jgi:hypothetical protein
MRSLEDDPAEANSYESLDNAAHVGDPSNFSLRAVGAVVLGAALATAGPFVFALLTILGFEASDDAEVLMLVVLMSFLVGTALFVSAGFVTYGLTRKAWLVPVPYALALVILLAGLWLT